MIRLRARASAAAASLVAITFVACAGPLQVMGRDDQPTPPAMAPPSPPHVHNDSTIELPSDVAIVEPSQPAVGSTQERALAHVHTPDGVCSGVVVGNRVVLTAHQCIKSMSGITTVAAGQPLFVEVATSSMTWTRRQVGLVVTPACAWEKLDIAALVVTEPIEWVTPLKVTTAPPPGAPVQALGFGRCAGETRGLSNRTGELLSRESDALVVALPLCRGDVGGPVIDPTSAQVLGLISHQDDPDDATRRTTTIMRLDTSPARALVAQASALADNPVAAGAQKPSPVACE